MKWACCYSRIILLWLWVCMAFTVCFFGACSNSVLDVDSDEQTDAVLIHSVALNFLELDDSEYPYAGIPRIVIETENRETINDRETEIPAKLQIWGEKKPESEIVDLTIRGRGNTTWAYPKKPYAIKFAKKRSFLGMAEAKKWVLLANYRDRTLLRNALAFEIAKRMDIGWTPQGKYVDVIINGEFLGNYYVCEKIEIKKNRLNLDDDDYLLELDSHYDADNKFKTSVKKIPVNIKNPEELTQDQFEYIRSFVNSVENFLYKEQTESFDIEQYIDYKSFALYWMICEIAKNEEPNHPKSVFMYKEKQKPLKLGPVWDFDFSTFIAEDGFKIQNSLWYDVLMSDSKFKKIVKSQWNEKKNDLFQMDDFIDSLSTYIKSSNEVNFELWPIKVKNYLAGDEFMNYDLAIKTLKESLHYRLTMMNSLIEEQF